MTHRLSTAALIICLAACGEKPADETVETTHSATTTPAGTALTEPQKIARTASTAGASVFFITPADGATVANPISIEFGIRLAIIKQIPGIIIC